MPYDFDTGKVRISGLIAEILRDEIAALANREDRQFSPMVSILLQEAIDTRNKSKNAKK